MNRSGVKEVLSAAILAITLGLQSVPLTSECVAFNSQGRVRQGEPFVKTLPGGLEFRLKPHDRGWDINIVDPRRPDDDYIALVSPPYRFAPHLSLDAREQPLKLNAFDRELHFVLNARDYARMMKVHQENWGDWQPIIKLREAITKGVVRLKVTGFGARAAGHDPSRELFDWITFEAEACIPR